MPNRNTYSFHLEITLEVGAEDTWAAHVQFREGLSEIYGSLGTFEFEIALHEIREPKGIVIFN